MSYKIRRSPTLVGSYTEVGSTDNKSIVLTNQPVGINYYKVEKVPGEALSTPIQQIVLPTPGSVSVEGIANGFDISTVAEDAFTTFISIEGKNMSGAWVQLASGPAPSSLSYTYPIRPVPSANKMFTHFRARGAALNASSIGPEVELPSEPAHLSFVAKITKFTQNGKKVSLTVKKYPTGEEDSGEGEAIIGAAVRVQAGDKDLFFEEPDTIEWPFEVTALLEFTTSYVKGIDFGDSRKYTYTPVVPAVPTGVTLVVTAEFINVNCTVAAGATEYEVELSGPGFTTPLLTKITTMPFTLPGAYTTGTYRARVRSYVQGWASEWSDFTTTTVGVVDKVITLQPMQEATDYMWSGYNRVMFAWHTGLAASGNGADGQGQAMSGRGGAEGIIRTSTPIDITNYSAISFISSTDVPKGGKYFVDTLPDHGSPAQYGYSGGEQAPGGIIRFMIRDSGDNHDDIMVSGAVPGETTYSGQPSGGGGGSVYNASLPGTAADYNGGDAGYGGAKGGSAGRVDVYWQSGNAPSLEYSLGRPGTPSGGRNGALAYLVLTFKV